MALTVLSFGAGQDSTAILYKCVLDPDFRQKYVKGRFIVVFSDTRNEHDHTYKHIGNIKKFCDDHKVEFYTIDPETYASNNWSEGLIKFYELKNAVGSKAFPKTCTDNLKIRPIYKFLELFVHYEFNTEKYGRKAAFYEFVQKHGKINVLIGIAKKEEKRASQNGSSGIKWFDECINKIYPLIETGMDRQACQDYIESIGKTVPFPSNCILCPFMSFQELLYLHRYNKKWFDKWVDLEKAKFDKNQHMGSKNLGVWGSTKPLTEVLKEAEEKYGHMTEEELIDYKMSHGHCVKSKY